MHLSAVIPFRQLFLIEYYTEDNFINAVQAFRIILVSGKVTQQINELEMKIITTLLYINCY